MRHVGSPLFAAIVCRKFAIAAAFSWHLAYKSAHQDPTDRQQNSEMRGKNAGENRPAIRRDRLLPILNKTKCLNLVRLSRTRSGNAPAPEGGAHRRDSIHRACICGACICGICIYGICQFRYATGNIGSPVEVR
jgi:hypothetical protein